MQAIIIRSLGGEILFERVTLGSVKSVPSFLDTG